MLINLRNALMSGKRLPYDAELEYLEFTGTQHIDSGINYFPDFDIDVLIPSGVPNVTLYSDTQHLLERKNASQPYWVVTAPESLLSSVPIAGRHRVVFRNSVLTIDNTTIGTVGNRTSGSDTCLIFRRKGGAAYNGTLYSLKMWDYNGVLVRDYIPVRKGTVGYLYDRVSGKLFGNAGTGDFVLGQDVVPVEYTESTGTQYIELPFGFDVTDEVFARISINTTQTTDKYMVAPKQWNTNNNRFALGVHTGFYTDAKYTAAFGGLTTGNTTLSPPTTNDGNLHDWHYANRTFEVTDLSLSLSVNSITFGGTTANLKLFYGYNTNTSGKIARYKHIKNGVVVIDLISVRVGTEGAMMDTLTRRIYRNAGTGAFTYGNDLKYPISAE